MKEKLMLYNIWQGQRKVVNCQQGGVLPEKNDLWLMIC